MSKATHRRRSTRSRRVAKTVAVLGVAGLTSLAAAAPAMAAKPTGGSSGTSSLKLVLLDSTDGLPHWGQTVTFDVQTTQTDQPHVSLQCYQSGVLVYSAQAGFYASYPWPWTQDMTLSSQMWTSGGADCTAVLYWFSGKKTVTGATLQFPVYS